MIDKFYDRAETLINYIAECDEGLQRQLSNEGARSITNAFLVWNALLAVLFVTFLVVAV